MEKLIVQIFLYIVLIVAMMFVLKKITNYYQRNGNASGKSIKIIEIAYLSKDRQLMVVEFDGKRYFLGVGNSSFTLIKELDLKDDEHED